MKNNSDVYFSLKKLSIVPGVAPAVTKANSARITAETYAATRKYAGEWLEARSDCIEPKYNITITTAITITTVH